jgi:hypothetical protein
MKSFTLFTLTQSFQSHYGHVPGIFLESKAQPASKVGNLAAIFKPIVWEIWEP